MGKEDDNLRGTGADDVMGTLEHRDATAMPAVSPTVASDAALPASPAAISQPASKAATAAVAAAAALPNAPPSTEAPAAAASGASSSTGAKPCAGLGDDGHPPTMNCAAEDPWNDKVEAATPETGRTPFLHPFLAGHAETVDEIWAGAMALKAKRLQERRLADDLPTADTPQGPS